ncbi:Reticulocyte-binding protein 2 homolog a [Durusdinium trenchii]|uniref:Reticulocyte-binding protein 2 homolog a n=1 Tax=Durusdinium trenchii TaxID=1381693 RepID=A0ABP0JW65_9DINO
MSQAYAAYAAQAAQAAAAAAPRQVGQNTGPWDELADEHNTGRLQGISGDVVGSVPHLSVTGCTHTTVGGIVRGNFTANGQNHGRPTYKKDAQVNGLDVLYYWDDRDGASFCGWWFGPKVGGDQVWAYHPSSTAMTPPKTGWKVPYDGPVDNSFLISPTTASQTAHVPSSDLSSYSSPYQTAEQRIKQQQQELMQQQMIAQQQKAVQMSEMKKKQEEARRQQEEARVRQQEEVKRKAAEQRMKMEEMTRQKMEQEKRLAEERKRQHNEQRAAMTLRHFLAQKIRVAKEEQDLSTAQQELAELMAQQLPLCGANAEKVQAECAQAVEITMKRIEAEKEKKRQEEERKEEQMKKQKEAQEKAEELLRELGEKVATAEELVEQLTASAEQLCPEKDMKLEIVTKLANSMDSKAAEATGAINDCQSFVKEHGNAMMAMAFSVKPPEGVEADERPANLPTMRLRMAEVLKKKEMLIHGIKSSKEKLFRKAEAKKKMDVQMLKFKKPPPQR